MKNMPTSAMALSLKNRLCHPSRQDLSALGLALLLWAVAIALTLATTPQLTFKKMMSYWKEAAGYLVLLTMLSQSRGFRSVLEGMGRVRMLLVAALVGLIFWGQLLRNSDISYPFVYWPMHTSSTNKPKTSFMEYQVTYANGQKGLYPFEKMGISEIVHNYSRRIVMDLNRNGNRDGEEEANNGVMDRLVRVYNVKNPGNPILGFRVSRCTVPVKNYTGPDSVERAVIVEKWLND